MRKARIKWGFVLDGKKYKPSRAVYVDLEDDVYLFAEERGLLMDEKKQKDLGAAPSNKKR